MGCGEPGESWGQPWGEVAPACVSGVQNFSPSTENPGCPPLAPTGPVDKKPTLTCEKAVIHGFHSPYYYSQLERAGNQD